MILEKGDDLDICAAPGSVPLYRQDGRRGDTPTGKQTDKQDTP